MCGLELLSCLHLSLGEELFVEEHVYLVIERGPLDTVHRASVPAWYGRRDLV